MIFLRIYFKQNVPNSFKEHNMLIVHWSIFIMSSKIGATNVSSMNMNDNMTSNVIKYSPLEFLSFELSSSDRLQSIVCLMHLLIRETDFLLNFQAFRKRLSLAKILTKTLISKFHIKLHYPNTHHMVYVETNKIHWQNDRIKKFNLVVWEVFLFVFLIIHLVCISMFKYIKSFDMEFNICPLNFATSLECTLVQHTKKWLLTVVANSNACKSTHKSIANCWFTLYEKWKSQMLPNNFLQILQTDDRFIYVETTHICAFFLEKIYHTIYFPIFHAKTKQFLVWFSRFIDSIKRFNLSLSLHIQLIAYVRWLNT